MLLTPTKRWFFQCSKSNVQPAEEWTNTIGLRLEDYVKCVKEAGEIWSCPVIDLNGESGLLPSVPGYLKYFRSRERDGLHPNTAGHVRLAQLVYHRLSALPGSFRGDLRAAEEVRMRGGIANFLAKARAGGKAGVSPAVKDALMALQALGFAADTASKMISDVLAKNPDVTETDRIIRLALAGK